MTSEIIVSNQETAIVEVRSQTSTLVETEMPGESDEVKRETKALIEAIKRRAQAEMQAAGTITREAYLKAIKQARAAIEENQLIEPDRIEHSIQMLQKDAEKSWLVIVGEIESFGFRLADIAQLAWRNLEKQLANMKKN